ncbi:MAG: HAD family hydrolase [Lachnospiraceae bacterium]|nr:HAD family hydrolase [Lachnospiraceae bacterium]
MYRNFIFDLYGTLVDIHTDEDSSIVWDKLSLFYGYQGAVYIPEELKETYERLVREAEAECREKMTEKGVEQHKQGAVIYYSHEGVPEIKVEKVFEKMYTLKSVKPDEGLVLHTCQLFRGLTTEYIRLYDGVHEMFKALRENGKKIYLLSNAQRVFTEYELNVLDIAKYFDAVLISSDYGVKKPDLSFFKILLNKYELNPEESIMIGNDENCDIAGAKRAGLDTYYIHSNISPDYTGNIEATYMQMEMDINKVCRTLEVSK